MSIALMTQAWKIQGLSAVQKVVLLSLADNANDQGECYPSIAQIVSRTCASERTVQGAIRALEELGYVKCLSRLGTSTIYFLSLDSEVIHSPRKCRTPAVAAPPQQMHPTPAAPAPKPSLNHQLNRQGTVKPARKRAPAFDADAIELPTWLDADDWRRWAKHRSEIKKPLTEEAARQQIAKLEDFLAQGWEPGKVINHAIASGWQGLFLPKEWGAAPKPGQGRPMNRQEALEQRNREIGRQWAERSADAAE